MAGSFVILDADMPPGFRYPDAFLRFLDSGTAALEPWNVLTANQQLHRRAGLAQRYPNRDLFPFARRQDNDDLACWVIGSDTVVVIHDFASPGWELRETFGSTDEWLRHDFDDSVDFQA
jgi:hypothetical protein